MATADESTPTTVAPVCFATSNAGPPHPHPRSTKRCVGPSDSACDNVARSVPVAKLNGLASSGYSSPNAVLQMSLSTVLETMRAYRSSKVRSIFWGSELFDDEVFIRPDVQNSGTRGRPHTI